MHMDEGFTVSFKGDHVRIDSHGKRSIEYATALWSKVISVCRENNCYLILGVSNAPNPMPIVDGFDHIDLFRRLEIRDKYRIAWAELNYEARSSTEFVETVLSNRGLYPGKLFSNEKDAREWLFSAPGESDDS